MSSDNPFRSELDAAHRRIETLEAEHTAKVDALQRENGRLRERLIDVTPSRNAMGRTFGALGMIILGVSLAAGIVVARVTRAPTSIPETDVIRIAHAPYSISPPTETLELPATDSRDFDRGDVAMVLDRIHLEDCVRPGANPASGHVKLMIAPSGMVSSATVDVGPYRDSPIGRCIEEHFRAARVSAFTGPSRLVGKSFVIRDP
jgi:hypothetical protein